ncbi:Lrp/AsnC family transcriptional regulator [Effusibacillus lacus]|uniref:AsnC family transcriptional regulator n=1 Tax=Effusibacillus lacus TaxID=1348429 RepID=A0A292YQR1_9BACL|nr:Lrp/AsnC family transcriptional regulator [Effusibacillus lacus]TCS70070.1 DNA-binding Lrp family transcriptional regulator [Effusibacillus lacus]GAX91093.1 AsnC family transcriptional regulator [Effusibacillus lacus]
MDSSLKLQILNLLEENSRLSHEDIASMLGVDPAEVTRWIKEMEQDKIILRYSTVINWDKVDTHKVTAVIDVKVTPQREVGFDAIAERIYRFPEVKSVSLMSGAYDLQVVIEGMHLKEVANFVAEKLSTIEHVNSTTTHFLLKTYKSNGVIFDDHEDDQRLVITP